MSDRSPTTHEDVLNRFWNELVRPTGDPDAAGDALDPATADAVRRLQSLGAAPPPASSRERVRRAVRADVESQLRSEEESPVNQTGFFDIARPFVGANGHADARPVPMRRLPVPRDRRPGFAYLVAGLLLLLGGLGFLALGPGLPDNPRRNTIPAAVVQEASPTPETTDELLLEVTLPAEALPRGEEISSGFAHYSIPPGTRGTWTPYCCSGPMVEYVVAGSYAVRAEAPIRVVRAGGSVEEVPAGTEIALGPGDALLSRVETVVEAANTGETPVELLNWVLIEDPTDSYYGHLLPYWRENDIDVRDVRHEQLGVSVPAGSAAVRLRRVELAPDAVIPAPPSGGTSFAVILRENAAGTPTRAVLIGTQSDGAIRNLGQVAATVYLVTVEPAAPGGAPSAASPTP